jgi:cytidyltransferase-like protein
MTKNITKIVINSGYFNPIHPGHIECMELSKNHVGDNGELWVIINNDAQAFAKRGVPSFQDQDYRMRIVEALKPVSRVFLAIDEDGSVCKSLKMLIAKARSEFGEDVEITYAKGGDRMVSEVPEAVLCRDLGVNIIDGLGLKTHNSSEYVKHTLNQ